MAIVQSEGALLDANISPWAGPVQRGFVGLYSDRVQDYASIYRTQPNVRLVVSFFARNVADIGWRSLTEVDAQDMRKLDRHHDLARFLRRPNPWTTRFRWVEALIADLKVYDTFAALKVRHPGDGRFIALRIPPYLFEPVGGSWLRPDGIRLLGNKSRPEFPLEQLIYVHGYNPTDPRRGSSPMEALHRIIAEEVAAGEWREQYLRNAARISGVIERPLEAPRWKAAGKNRFIEEWQASWAGSNTALAGATPILEEGMVWKDASFSPKDSEYLAARVLSRGETAAQYHLSPLFVGILDNANFSNVSEQHKHLYQDTLGPDLTMLEEEFDAQVVSEFIDLDPDTTFVKFNLEEKLRGSFEEESAVIQTLVGAPILTRDEGRGRLGIGPIPGGDQLVTPLNVLIGGQASPTDSAPPLGSRARKALNGGRHVHTKAADDLPHDVRGWYAKHAEVLASFFDRQRASVMAKLRAGKTLDEAFSDDRWNTELSNDLFAMSHTMTADVGAQVAEHLGGSFDITRCEAWLRVNADKGAENINGTTRAALADALSTSSGSGTRSRKDATADDGEDEEDPLDLADGVFVVAAGARAAQIGLSRVTSIGNFGRHDAATQSGAGSKTWIVNSGNSRHPEMDGETVDIGDDFSNGGKWPGDPDLDVSENAGCTCSLDFGQ